MANEAEVAEIKRRVNIYISRFKGRRLISNEIVDGTVVIKYAVLNPVDALSLQITKDKEVEGLTREFSELLVKETRTFENLLNNKSFE